MQLTREKKGGGGKTKKRPFKLVQKNSPLRPFFSGHRMQEVLPGKGQKMQKKNATYKGKKAPSEKKCKKCNHTAKNAKWPKMQKKINAFAYLALPCLIGIFPINTRNSWDTWLFLGCWPFLGHWLLLGHRLFLRHRLILEHWLFLGQNPQILVFIFYRCKTVFCMF